MPRKGKGVRRILREEKRHQEKKKQSKKAETKIKDEINIFHKKTKLTEIREKDLDSNNH